MDSKWLEIAKKLAEDARAGLAIERKRLSEIITERQKQVPAGPHSSGSAEARNRSKL
jgi:hypothetical protein